MCLYTLVVHLHMQCASAQQVHLHVQVQWICYRDDISTLGNLPRQNTNFYSHEFFLRTIWIVELQSMAGIRYAVGGQDEKVNYVLALCV